MESRKRRKLANANSSNTSSPDKIPNKNTDHHQQLDAHPVAEEDWPHTNISAAISPPDRVTLGRGGDDSDGEARNWDQKAEPRDRKKVKEEGELLKKSGERSRAIQEVYLKKGEDRVKVSKEGDSKKKGSQEWELRKSGDRFKDGEAKKSGERKVSKEGELKKSRDRLNVVQEGETNSRRKPSSRERRSEKSGRVDGKEGGSVEREEVRGSEGRDGSETNGRGVVGFSDGGVGSRHGGGGNGKKKVDGSKVGKVGDEGRMSRGEIKQEDEREGRTIANAAVHGSGGMSRARGEREKHSGRGFDDERGEWQYSEYGKGLDMKESGIGESREGWRERRDLDERFDVGEDGRGDANWTPFDDYLAATSGRGVDRGEERLSRRVSREDRAESSGERIETADVVSDQSRGRKKSAHKANSSWDGSEEVKGRGRAKRSREDDRRVRSRGKDRGDGVHDDSDSGARGSGRRRGDESRSHRSQARNGGVSEWGDLEAVTRFSGKSKTEKNAGEGDRIERTSSGRGRRELGREEADDSVRSSSRGRAENGLDEWAEKPGISGGLTVSEPSGEALKTSSKAKGENEADRLQKQRDIVGKERADGIMDGIDSAGRLRGRSRGHDNRHEKMKSRDAADGSRDESDGGKSSSRLRRGGKSLRDTWSSDGRKAFRGDVDDWGWVDDDESDQERVSGRNDRDFDRARYNDGSWDNARHRQWEEDGDRHRIRHRDGPDFGRKRDRAERDRSDRERQERGFYGGVGAEGSAGPNGMAHLNDMMGRGPPGIPPAGSMMDSGRGILSAGPFFPRAGGDSGVVQGEFIPGMSDLDSEGLNHDERIRGADVGYNEMRERHMDDEPPPGLDPAVGPSPGRGGGNDGSGGFNVHGGRGRAKGSNNRSRGAMQMHDNRPPFVNNQGAGMMIRGMPGSKGGRGGRGPGKIARVGGRDGQRGAMTVISQMSPGMPGPLFGQLGPPGPIGGLGPGIMGPGNFPLPPFGGRMGWNGGGDMSMMNGPPGQVPGPSRFVPGMGPGLPGLVPNVFFPSPGPVRGGPGGMVLGGMFGGGSPFGGRQGPLIGDRGPSGGRSIARGGGAAGRGPSRGEQNDYSQHFVDTGLRPQNFIRDVDLADRFEEYPKLKELIARKDKLIADRATPPMYMQCDLRTTELRPEVFGTKFDVILVDPPWEEYVRRAPGVGDSMEWWSHADIQNLRIEAISDTPAFIFLWVGDAEGLDQGRVCLKKWGFRRCEDICWVKTNRENPTPALRHDSNTVLQHSKEHCLMGIKGTVRRSTDGHVIHANVDTDIIISEEPDYGSTAKPEELYHIIEHFAQGQRRIELFGEDHNIRAGWVTVGKGLSSSNFSPQIYSKHFLDSEGKVWQGGRGNPPVDAPHLVGTTSEIESLRPKSPPPRAAPQPPPPATNSGQPSGSISISKRTSSLPQGGLPIVSGAGHTAVPPAETSPVANAGKGGNNGQTPTVAEATGLPDTKLPGVNLAAAMVANDEKGLGKEVADAPVELEKNAKADQ